MAPPARAPPRTADRGPVTCASEEPGTRTRRGWRSMDMRLVYLARHRADPVFCLGVRDRQCRYDTLCIPTPAAAGRIALAGGSLVFQLDSHPSGRHFLQIPGPTNVPDRVLRAIDQPTIDHRGPEFARLTLEILDGLKEVFQTSGPVIIYPASGTGAWEAALVNTLSAGDRVLMFETGHFADAVARAGREARPRRRFRAGRLAQRHRRRARRSEARRGSRARDQGRAGRPQRDLDRRDLAHPADPAGDRSRRATPRC